jgi:hypothetical protein
MRQAESKLFIGYQNGMRLKSSGKIFRRINIDLVIPTSGMINTLPFGQEVYKLSERFLDVRKSAVIRLKKVEHLRKYYWATRGKQTIYKMLWLIVLLTEFWDKIS